MIMEGARDYLLVFQTQELGTGFKPESDHLSSHPPIPC